MRSQNHLTATVRKITCFAALAALAAACSVDQTPAGAEQASQVLAAAPVDATVQLSESAVQSLRFLRDVGKSALTPANASAAAVASYLSFVQPNIALQNARLSAASGASPGPSSQVLIVDAAVVGQGDVGPIVGSLHLRVKATKPTFSIDPLAMKYEAQTQTTAFADEGEPLDAASLVAIRTVLNLTGGIAANPDQPADYLATFKSFLVGKFSLHSATVTGTSRSKVQTVVLAGNVLGATPSSPIDGRYTLTITATRPDFAVSPLTLDYQVKLVTTPVE